MEKQNITKGGKVMKNRIWLIAVMVMVAGLLFASFAIANSFQFWTGLPKRSSRSTRHRTASSCGSKRASQSPKGGNELCRF